MRESEAFASRVTKINIRPGEGFTKEEYKEIIRTLKKNTEIGSVADEIGELFWDVRGIYEGADGMLTMRALMRMLALPRPVLLWL